MRIALLIVFLTFLLAGCRNPEAKKVNSVELQEHIIGKWWFDNYSPEGPFVLVTFSPGGHLTMVNTNNPNAMMVEERYWRVATDGTLWITKTREPDSWSNFEMFTLHHMTDNAMIFTHLSVAGRMTFKKFTE